MSAIFVPFVRTLKPGAKGPDVRALKRALKRAGFGNGIVLTPSLGHSALRQLHRFQAAHHLKQGNYTLETHKALARFYDARGANLFAQEKAELIKNVELQMRARVVAAMMLLYHNRAAVHYTQGGQRMQGVVQHLRPPKFPTYADCSAAATWAYFAAGAPDPNDLGYNGTGYTGTLSKQGHKVGLAAAAPGDLVFYGSRWPWEHVAVYIGSNKVLSHGSEAGPYLLPIDYRQDRGEIRSYL